MKVKEPKGLYLAAVSKQAKFGANDRLYIIPSS